MHIPSLPTGRKALKRVWTRIVLHRVSTFRTVAVLAAAVASNAHAQTHLRAVGGGGGGAFQESCAAPAMLSGIEVRSGDYVDALRLLCVTATGPHEIGAPAHSEWHGGFGGGARRVICPAHAPVVWGMYVGIDRNEGVINDVKLYCRGVTDITRSESVRLRPREDGLESNQTSGDCLQGQVAIGLHGREGRYIDALGLICDAPPLALTPPPPPKAVTIKSASTSLSSAKAATAPAASSNASTTGPKSSGAAGGNNPPSPAGVPGTVPPSTPAPPSPPAQPSQQQARDEALKEMMRGVVSLIQEVRKKRNRAPGAASDRSGSNDQGHESLPREAQATAGVDQDAATGQLAPPDGSIGVEVRYAAAYGYREATGPVNPLPNSCGAFYISAVPLSDVRPRDPTRIDTLSARRATDGAYVCEYMIYNQPLGAAVLVRVDMSDPRAARSETWLGGSQPQPPPGQRRTIVDGSRQIVLTADRPRMSMVFEMVYASAP